MNKDDRLTVTERLIVNEIRADARDAHNGSYLPVGAAEVLKNCRDSPAIAAIPVPSA